MKKDFLRERNILHNNVEPGKFIAISLAVHQSNRVFSLFRNIWKQPSWNPYIDVVFSFESLAPDSFGLGDLSILFFSQYLFCYVFELSLDYFSKVPPLWTVFFPIDELVQSNFSSGFVDWHGSDPGDLNLTGGSSCAIWIQDRDECTQST